MRSLTYEELLKISICSPLDVVNDSGFEKTLQLVHQMLSDKEWDESLHLYSTQLLEALRKKYSVEWNSHWRYDAFLGYAYDIVLNFDERFAAYQRAFEKAKPAPPELLIALARCCSCPGKPPVSRQEAIVLAKEALSSTYYVDAVIFLRGLYRYTGDCKEEAHWDEILHQMQKEGKNLPSLDFMDE